MKKNKKRIIIATLVFLLVFMAVGFSILYQNLTINSTTKFSGSWKIFISKVEVYEKSAMASVNGYQVSEDGLTADLDVELQAPGDYVYFNVTIKNAGTMNGVVANVNKTLLSGDNNIELSHDLTIDQEISPNNEITFMVKIYCPETVETMTTGSETKYQLEIIINQKTNALPEDDDDETDYYFQLVDDEADIDEVGTEVKIANEHFYVISHDDETVTLLSKYNLLVGNVYNNNYEYVSTFSESDEGYGLQSENAKGWEENESECVGKVNFDDDNETNSFGYWTTSIDGLPLSQYGTGYPAYVYDDNASIKTYVDKYKNTLELEYDISIQEARLIKYEELINLGCTVNPNSCSSAPSWVYNISYWSGSAFNHGQLYVESNNIYHTWFEYGSVGDCFGVRPVITISKSLF